MAGHMRGGEQMPGVVAFTSNIEDLSTQEGYQFEFRCV